VPFSSDPLENEAQILLLRPDLSLMGTNTPPPRGALKIKGVQAVRIDLFTYHDRLKNTTANLI
jgi:hypothetical protein